MIGEGAGGGLAVGDLVWIREADYGGMQLAGKIVLRKETESRSREVSQALEHGAGGLILVTDLNEKELKAKNPFPASMPAEDTIPVVRITDDALIKLLTAGGYSQQDINTSPSALPLRLDVRIEVPLQAPTTVTTANVLGLLPGSDPVLSQEIIVVGAHYDHVGDDPDGKIKGLKYPGANDDATGVGIMLETARQWQGPAIGRHVAFYLLPGVHRKWERLALASTWHIPHFRWPTPSTCFSSTQWVAARGTIC